MTQIPDAHSCTCWYQICQAHISRRCLWASQDWVSTVAQKLVSLLLCSITAKPSVCRIWVAGWQGRTVPSPLCCGGKGVPEGLHLRPHPNNSASHAQRGGCWAEHMREGGKIVWRVHHVQIFSVCILYPSLQHPCMVGHYYLYLTKGEIDWNWWKLALGHMTNFSWHRKLLIWALSASSYCLSNKWRSNDFNQVHLLVTIVRFHDRALWSL